MTYTIGRRGCNIQKDGSTITEAEVLALLEQRDHLLEAALGAIAALSQTAVFDADINVAKTWLARAAGVEAIPQQTSMLAVKAYSLEKDPESHEEITLERIPFPGGYRWGIYFGSRLCLSKEESFGMFHFILEPMPSSRNDEYYKLCRWDTAAEAYKFYRENRPHIAGTAAERREFYHKRAGITLRVFEIDSGGAKDWVVAESADAAERLLLLYYGSGDDASDWIVFPMDDEAEMSIEFEDMTAANRSPVNFPETVRLTTLDDETVIATDTCGQWAKRNKPGFLCSTEW